MANQQPNQPATTPANEAGRRGEKDSHAAGSGSSTGDPGNARGQSGGKGAQNPKQDTFGTPPDEAATPID
jgi:hypothetical protein